MHGLRRCFVKVLLCSVLVLRSCVCVAGRHSESASQEMTGALRDATAAL